MPSPRTEVPGLRSKPDRLCCIGLSENWGRECDVALLTFALLLNEFFLKVFFLSPPFVFFYIKCMFLLDFLLFRSLISTLTS